MKCLTIKGLEEPVQIDYSFTLTIVLENQHLYYQTMSNFHIRNETNEIILYEDEKTIKLEDFVFPIFNLFDFDFTDKRLTNQLQRKLVLYAEQYLRPKFDQIKIQIDSFLDEVYLDSNTQFAFSNELDVKDLIKISNPVFIENYDNKVEKTISYLKILNDIFQYDIFVFNNLHSILTPDEFDVFISECQYLKFFILDVVPFQPIYRGKDEKIKIIDKDLCEI